MGGATHELSHVVIASRGLWRLSNPHLLPPPGGARRRTCDSAGLRLHLSQARPAVRSGTQWPTAPRHRPSPAAVFHSDDNFSSGMSLSIVPESFCCLTQWEASIDHRHNLAGLKKTSYEGQILLA